MLVIITLASLVCTFIGMWVFETKLPIQFNEKLEDPFTKQFSHNYILFSDKKNRVQKKITEINGWLQLEALMLHELEKKIDPPLSSVLSLFGDHEIYLWWPTTSQFGQKEYFLGQEPIPLYPDIDDTGWGLAVRGKSITPQAARIFLSSEELPENFQKICLEIKCKKELLFRVWGTPSWHDDLDIVSTSNIVSIMGRSDKEKQILFQENVRLINSVIENHSYEEFFKYFEPKITGTFLLLYYDQARIPFLSSAAKRKLTQHLYSHIEELKNASLIARWGGGADWFHGFLISTVNDRIPSLMYEYCRTKLLPSLQNFK